MENREKTQKNRKHILEYGEMIRKMEIRSFKRYKNMKKTEKMSVLTILQMFYIIEILRKYREYYRNTVLLEYGVL